MEEPMYPWKRAYPRVDINALYTIVCLLLFITIIVIYLITLEFP